MHDFWNFEAGTEQSHEMQNFIKNLGIMAGLMFVAGSRSSEQTVPDEPAPSESR